MAANCLGIDMGAHSIKIVEARRVRRAMQISQYGRLATPAKSFGQRKVTDPQAMAKGLQSLLAELAITAKNAVIGVTSAEMTIKSTSLPLMSKRELGNAIQYELTNLVGFSFGDPKELVYSYDVIHKGSEQQDVLFTACRRTLVEPYINAVEQAGLVPTVIDVHAFALPRVADFAQQKVCYIDMGAKSTYLFVDNQGRFRMHRILDIGGDHFDNAIAESYGLSLEEAGDLKESENIDSLLVQGTGAKTALRSVLQQFVGGILQTMDFLRAQERASTFTQILDFVVISGGLSHLKGFREMLQDELGIDVRLLDPFAHVPLASSVEPPSDAGRYAAAVGLALRGLAR